MLSSYSQQLYNIFPRLMEHLSWSHHTILRKIDDIHTFILNKVKEHEQNLDFHDPKDFIDCFLIRLTQVSSLYDDFKLNYVAYI